MNVHVYDIYCERLSEAIKRAGNLHTVADILDAIAQGKMQSFSQGNTWIITSVNLFPQRRVLDINYLVGDLGDAEELHDKVVEFARSSGCTMIRAFGRVGWRALASKHGWRFNDAIYMKDLVG